MTAKRDTGQPVVKPLDVRGEADAAGYRRLFSASRPALIERDPEETPEQAFGTPDAPAGIETRATSDAAGLVVLAGSLSEPVQVVERGPSPEEAFAAADKGSR